MIEFWTFEMYSSYVTSEHPNKNVNPYPAEHDYCRF